MGRLSRNRKLISPFRGAPNKSLDASGGGASRNFLGAAKGALIRAAASTQPFGAYKNETGPSIPVCRQR
jgi:hypothetical protein